MAAPGTHKAGRGDRQQLYEEAGLRDLRRDALNLTLGVVGATAVGLVFATGALIEHLGHWPAVLGAALALLVGITYVLSRRHVRLASAVLVASLVGAVALGVQLFPERPMMAALAVPILIATALLEAWGGAATWLLGSPLVAAVALRQAGADPWDVVLLTAGLGGLVLAFAAALWRALYTVLDWSWSSYQEARKRTAELRERQAELGRLTLSLSHAYSRLEQTAAELERAREAAEEARRLKTEFAASISHELRTPLNLVIGLSELMAIAPSHTGVALPEAYRADVEAIYRNACHISNLIDDVLDLSQVDAHRLGLVREWTELREVVAQAASTVRTLFDNTGLALDVRVPDDLPPVFVDPVRIRQILINLLNNAVRFTEEGGVTVEARVEGEQVVVDVSDTGVGIPAADLPWVFQEFWQAGEPTRGRRGSGLGLAISKRLAELHGGNMLVRSEPGRGSTFSLVLPLGEKAIVHEVDLAVPRWQRLEQQAADSPTVLLVAPEPEALRVFQRYLDGYQVAVASDAESAAQLAARPAVRAVVVADAARRDAVREALRLAEGGQASRPPPLITCALRTSRTLAQQLGVSEYLVKPIGQPQLQMALRRFGRAPRDLVVADDDPEMLHLLTRMLAALAPRCQVRVASDGRQALDLLREHPPQGLILDLLMPGLDGYGVLAQMREDPALSAVPVVVVTARGAEDEDLVADTLEVSRVGGLRVGELVRWLKAGLDARPQA